MFPAARVLDPLTHDMIVPCGVIAGPPPMVIIEGMPAAHVGMECVCSGAINQGVVHPPMPPLPPTPKIVKGSTTVMINNQPAARWVMSMDMTSCGAFLGLPPLIATRTTFIGG